MKVHKSRDVKNLLDMIKIWFAKATKEHFDDYQDEFALIYRGAALDVLKSLEDEGITDDCKLTLLHERYNANLIVPKEQMQLSSSAKAPAAQPQPEEVIIENEPCSAQFLPKPPAEGYTIVPSMEEMA